ncbi:uncharacterized protein [Antedon mediterranea]|uniref:uncharacterized protein n=1 Tax=Antedon mediterranea TaxID=105859 RepID=UPI003AF57900
MAIEKSIWLRLRDFIPLTRELLQVTRNISNVTGAEMLDYQTGSNIFKCKQATKDDIVVARENGSVRLYNGLPGQRGMPLTPSHLQNHQQLTCQAANSECTGKDVYFDEKTQTCKTCPTTCPPGYGYFERDCGNGEMKRDRCTACVTGKTYSETEDDSRCHPCNLCPNQQTIRSCTNESSAVCGACHSGYGWDSRRETCTRCEHKDRGNLFGCEDPPTVSFKNVVNVVCELSSNRADTRYVWYRNDEALDTTDENKFVEKGKMLFILEPDDAVYYCKAVWDADSQHNFRIEKKSINFANISIENTEENKNYESVQACVNSTSDDNDSRKPGYFFCVKMDFKTFNFWIFILSVVNMTVIILFCAFKGIKGYCCMRGLPRYATQIYIPPQTSSSTNYISDKDCTANIEMVTRTCTKKKPEDETNSSSLLYKAYEYCNGFGYTDLNINTTDRLAELLNPRKDPEPPIKCWRHLASALGITDQARINSLGSYVRLHQYLHTLELPMEKFLTALKEVGNSEAINVVCRAIIKLKEDQTAAADNVTVKDEVHQKMLTGKDEDDDNDDVFDDNDDVFDDNDDINNDCDAPCIPKKRTFHGEILTTCV